MVKIIGSVVFLICLVIGGYFVDAKFKSQIDGLIGSNKTTDVVTPNVEPKTGSPRASGAFANILETGMVRVSAQNPSKPFYFADGNRAKGFNVDFMNLMFAQGPFTGKINSTKVFDVATYPDVPNQLLTDKSIDLAIDGLTFNDEDLPGVVYTIPYVKDFGYSLITTQGQTVASAADLAGGKLGVLKGDPDAKAFAESAFPGVKIVELSDNADANGKWIVGHIKSKTVDAVMYDYPFAVAEIDGTDLQFAISKIKGSDIQYRIGVRKTEPALLAALNTAIRNAMEDPSYPEMLKTYFMSTKVAAVRRVTSGEATYVVVKGDTLSTIAQAQLGNKMRYSDIQSRNNLANPNFIAVGQKLVIPK